MSRRRRHPVSLVSCAAPGGLLVAGWAHLGEPLHQAGLGAVLFAGLLTGLLMPGAIVSVRALPQLLVPRRMRCWWRRGQDHRPAIPVFLRRAVLAADHYCCCWCGATLSLQMDHVRPWSLGGLNALWNLVTLCGRCNRVKSNYWRDRDGYVHYRGFDGSENAVEAARILAYERRHRWHPGRWVRAGLTLAA
jgi:5-methylcytosine-specific restriction endonuclease McrA